MLSPIRPVMERVGIYLFFQFFICSEDKPLSLLMRRTSNSCGFRRDLFRGTFFLAGSNGCSFQAYKVVWLTMVNVLIHEIQWLARGNLKVWGMDRWLPGRRVLQKATNVAACPQELFSDGYRPLPKPLEAGKAQFFKFLWLASKRGMLQAWGGAGSPERMWGGCRYM